MLHRLQSRDFGDSITLHDLMVARSFNNLGGVDACTLFDLLKEW